MSPLRVAIGVHGTRGDIEPIAVVARGLRERGHEVRLAVPPNLLSFVDSLGLGTAVPYGVDSEAQLGEPAFTRWWEPRSPVSAWREARDYATQGWEQMGRALDGLASGADLVLTGTTYQEVAATVAEAHRVPLATLHAFPLRPSGALLRMPPALTRPTFAGVEWAQWRLVREAEAQQRSALGLPPARTRSAVRIAASALEVQSFEPALFPGLDREWEGVRPFSGTLTLGLPGPEDERVLTWAAAGRPPVYVGLGSMGGDAAAERLPMVVRALRGRGERVLVCADRLDHDPDDDAVLRVRVVGHADVLPACRAVVHHGGAGTIAAGLRAGRPTLVLWVGADQPLWGRQVRRLGVGGSHRLARVTPEGLREAVDRLLQPEVAARAAGLSHRLTRPDEAARRAVDLVERRGWRGR